MFNDLFMNYDVEMFNSWVAEMKKKNQLKSSAEDLTNILIEGLKEEAIKRKKNNMAAFGIDDKTLEKALIKADGLVPKWKESKNKKEKPAPKNTTVGNNYYDKNGQKHRKKTETKKTETKKTSNKKSEFEKFDMTQLELFDFE